MHAVPFIVSTSCISSSPLPTLHLGTIIDPCVSNANSRPVWYAGRHEAEGDGGGVGAAAATRDAVAGERTLARDGCAHGRGGVQRRMAVAGSRAPAWARPGGGGNPPRPTPPNYGART